MGQGLRKRLIGARGWLLPVVGVVMLLGAGGGGSALAAGSSGSGSGRVRVGRSPALASAARAIGALPAGVRMHVTVVLKPRHPSALAAYAREVSTPGSSVYHAYLDPAQFAARFGATAAEVRAVKSSLRSHGLKPGAVTANRLAVLVTGTAGQMERAFAISFRRVALRAGKRAVVASAAPALDRAIAGDVQSVIGLSSISAPRPLLRSALAAPVSASAASGSGPITRSRRAELHAAADGPQPCTDATGAAQSDNIYTTDQIASAYGFDGLYAEGAEGHGETVAVYELESYDSSDIDAYQACYGTSAKITNVPVDGGPNDGGGPGSGEAALDIEQVVGLAPKASVLVYQGPNSVSNAPGSGPYDTLSAIISQDRAQVISTSWGDCEQAQAAQGGDVLSAESTLFQEAAAQGQSVVAAAGDDGSEDCDGVGGLSDDQLAVDDPGSQPFVTSAGGTTLETLGPPPSETVWNAGSSCSGPQCGAGGGGVSQAWQMPGYQSNAASSLHVIGPDSSGSSCDNGSGYCRQVPDVAADADPTTGSVFYWDGGWLGGGGTSAAAPLWAALLADADSTSACHGSAIGFANPALYRAAGTAYGSDFNDITSGNNDFTGTNGGLYPAGPGYDMATGLGTPKAAPLAAALCVDSLRVNNPGPQHSTVGKPVSLLITAAAPHGAKLQFEASQLPPGLSISSSSGRITGRPKKTGTWLTGVAALDQNLSFRAAFFWWRVVGVPKLSGLTLAGVHAGHPKLRFTLSAGSGAPPLKGFWVQLSRGLRFAAAKGKVRIINARGKRVGFALHVNGGRLHVVLPDPASRIRVTIVSGAIRIGSGLAADVRRKTGKVVTVTVTTTNSSGETVAAVARRRVGG